MVGGGVWFGAVFWGWLGGPFFWRAGGGGVQGWGFGEGQRKRLRVLGLKYSQGITPGCLKMNFFPLEEITISPPLSRNMVLGTPNKQNYID